MVSRRCAEGVSLLGGDARRLTARASARTAGEEGTEIHEESTFDELLDATEAFVAALAAYTHTPQEGRDLLVTTILYSALEQADGKCFACTSPVESADLALFAYRHQDGERLRFQGLLVCAQCQNDPDSEDFVFRRVQGEDGFELVEAAVCPDCDEIVQPWTLIYLRDLRQRDVVTRTCGR